jgi:hypothetical protein
VGEEDLAGPDRHRRRKVREALRRAPDAAVAPPQTGGHHDHSQTVRDPCPFGAPRSRGRMPHFGTERARAPPGHRTGQGDSGSAPDVRNHDARGTRGVESDLRGSREARPGDADRAGARADGVVVAKIHGGDAGAADRSAHGRVGAGSRTGIRLESRAAGSDGAGPHRPLRSLAGRPGPASFE